MAIPATYIGEFRKGDRVQWPVEYINTPTWTPNYFDVYDNTNARLVLSDRTLDILTDMPAAIKFIDFQLADIFDTDSERSFTWVEGRTYLILVKSGVGASPTNSIACTFKVATEALQAAFLGFAEYGKNFYFIVKEEDRSALWFDLIDPKNDSLVAGNQTMTGPTHGFGGNRAFSGSVDTDANSLVIGRTYWLRVKDLAVADPNLDKMYSFTVIPALEFELKRLLSYAGENLVLDNFSYDQAGNITGLRVRGFDSAANADDATASVTDPEPGELFACVVDQEHDVARNVRTFHKSVREFLTTTFPSDP